MSLTDEEKIRRIATPHTVDVEVIHEMNVQMTYPEFKDRTGGFFGIPFNIPNKTISAINTSAHRKLRETNLFFRDPYGGASGADVSLLQNTVNSSATYLWPPGSGNYSDNRRKYGMFSYSQTLGDPPYYYWRGNAKAKGTWNNVIAAGGVLTMWEINTIAAATVNLSLDPIYEFFDCALRKTLMEKQGATAGINYFQVDIPIPLDSITDFRYYLYGIERRDVELNDDAHLRIIFRAATIPTEYGVPNNTQSIRSLSPSSYSLEGTFGEYQAQGYWSLALFGNNTTAYQNATVTIDGSDIESVSFDPERYTKTHTIRPAVGYAHYPTIAGTPQDPVYIIPPSPTSPNAEIVVELQPIFAIDPGEEYVTDGYAFGGNLVSLLDSTLFHLQDMPGTNEAGQQYSLYQHAEKIFGYQDEKHETQYNNNTITCKSDLKTTFDFKPKYL